MLWEHTLRSADVEAARQRLRSMAEDYLDSPAQLTDRVVRGRCRSPHHRGETMACVEMYEDEYIAHSSRSHRRGWSFRLRCEDPYCGGVSSGELQQRAQKAARRDRERAEVEIHDWDVRQKAFAVRVGLYPHGHQTVRVFDRKYHRCVAVCQNVQLTLPSHVDACLEHVPPRLRAQVGRALRTIASDISWETARENAS